MLKTLKTLFKQDKEMWIRTAALSATTFWI